MLIKTFEQTTKQTIKRVNLFKKAIKCYFINQFIQNSLEMAITSRNKKNHFRNKFNIFKLTEFKLSKLN
jgi:hypothetical protein